MTYCGIILSNPPGFSLNRTDPTAADGEKKRKGKDSSLAGAMAAKDKHRKTKMARMSQSEIDLFLSYNPEPLDPVPGMSQDMVEYYAEIDAKIEMVEKELLEHKEMIQKQYKEKGCVEYEVYDDEENQAPVPRLERVKERLASRRMRRKRRKAKAKGSQLLWILLSGLRLFQRSIEKRRR